MAVGGPARRRGSGHGRPAGAAARARRIDFRWLVATAAAAVALLLAATTAGAVSEQAGRSTAPPVCEQQQQPQRPIASPEEYLIGRNSARPLAYSSRI